MEGVSQGEQKGRSDHQCLWLVRHLQEQNRLGDLKERWLSILLVLFNIFRKSWEAFMVDHALSPCLVLGPLSLLF